MTRLLVLFLDGVGIGSTDPRVNPFLGARLPVLSDLLDGTLPTLETPSPAGPRARAFPVDAALGVPGIPQSGTGQVALLTGVNAPRILGRHFGPWPPVRLRPVLEGKSFLRTAVETGLTVVFANAVPVGYPDGRDSRRVAAPSLAARAAGLLHRHEAELAAGLAVASEIVNEGWRQWLGSRIPGVTPEEAGGNLARLSRSARLTFFAHYDTDVAGHRGGMAGAVRALERVDRFLDGLLSNLPEDALLLVVSDHGNVEDVRGGHTRNPALGLLAGAAAFEVAPPANLTEVSRLVLDRLLA